MLLSRIFGFAASAAAAPPGETDPVRKTTLAVRLKFGDQLPVARETEEGGE